MKTFTKFCIGLFFLFTVHATFAQQITMQLFKPTGSGVPDYTAEIPITTAQFSFTNASTVGSATSGAGGGKVVFLPLVITKLVDPSTAIIERNLYAGAHYGNVRLNFYRTNSSGGRELVYRVGFGTVFTTGYSGSADPAACGCPAISETITFAYGIVSTYVPASVTGGNPQIVGWDQTKNIQYGASDLVLP